MTNEVLRTRKELLKPEELFARAYTQWIVRKSGHERLQAQMDRDNVANWKAKYFDERTAARFSQLLTGLLEQHGWTVKSQP
jgi:hypothetical protein